MKSKEQKREQAVARQRMYDAISKAEKIQLTQARRGESKKELARLIKASIDHNKK